MVVWMSGLMLIGVLGDPADSCRADARGYCCVSPQHPRSVLDTQAEVGEQERDGPHFPELALNGCARPRFDERGCHAGPKPAGRRVTAVLFAVAPVRPASVPIIYALCSLRI